MGNVLVIIVSIAVALVAFGFVVLLYFWIKKQPSSNEKIAEVGALIRQGANTFLWKEYKMLAVFAGIVAFCIFLFMPKPIWSGDFVGLLGDRLLAVCAYAMGTVFSAIAGKIGIHIATIANIKTAEAAQKGIRPSFLCGFRGGAVMGLAVVASSVLGIAIIYALTLTPIINNPGTLTLAFSFGASSLALFAKAGGGIFTKTADISADLVGKVELGIPEDDPRNPAVIADNVGDNVGDVAGMGADLFDSHVASMAAALVMAFNIGAEKNIFMAFSFAIIGLVASIIGIGLARMTKKSGPTTALNMSTYITTGIFLVLSALATAIFQFEWRIWGASAIGLFVGVLIGIVTDYFTNDQRKPVKTVAEASKSGPAFTILSGVSYGFLSVLPAMVGIAVSALAAYYICLPLEATMPGASMFGIAMAAVGMLSIVAMIISNDAYGPIVDNARGLAEMGNLGEEPLEITDKLDSAGNTVKAITKGFAIGAAGLTVIALLGTFMSEVNVEAAERGMELLTGFDILDPLVFFGLLIGVAVPAVFSALQILGVNRNAQRMVAEIHRQFNEIPGLKEGDPNAKPEYDKCIIIATNGAIRELIVAGLFAIIITLLVGFIGGVRAIGGFLTGNIASGLLLALFMSNSGGLWDNGKKYIESGECGGKGSDAHKAAVVGDTVGDPFKDTSGPSINTQITVVSLLSTLMGGIFLTTNLFNLIG